MWCIVFVLYKLLMSMTNNSYLSMGVLLAYGTTSMFINMILFIRMYAQLAFVSIALAYLIKIYWDKKLDIKFYMFFSVILLSGMLTQYYFLFFAFAICFLFAVRLFFVKRIKEIIISLVTVCVDAGIYLVLWRHVFKHVFGDYRGEQAMEAAISLSSIKNIVLMALSMDYYLFWGLYLIISVALIVVYIKKLKAGKVAFTYEYALVYSAVFYLIMVGKVAPYQSFRYISPVAFIFVYAGVVVISNLFTKRWDLKKSISIVVAACLIANFAGFAAFKFYAEMDYYSKARVQLFEDLEGKELVIYIHEDWVAPVYFEPIQHAKSYVFLDAEHQDLVDEYNKPGYIWAIYAEHADNLPEAVKGKCIYSGNENYYVIE